MYMIKSMLAASLMVTTAASSAQERFKPDETSAQAVGELGASEDVFVIPGTRWLIVSVHSFDPKDAGALELVDTDDGSIRRFYPEGAEAPRAGSGTQPKCAEGPPQRFDPHGISIRPGKDGEHTLYVVHHGVRESVEIFHLDAKGSLPKIAWEGCVLTPQGVTGNAVAPTADGFVMTRTILPAPSEAAAWIAKLKAGERMGEVLSWTSRDGWKKIETGVDVMPNGIEVSPDGKWLFYSDSELETFNRIALGQSPVQKDVIKTGFHTDNIHWAPDGSLLLAGQTGEVGQITKCAFALLESACGRSVVWRIDPATLKTQVLLDTDHYRRASGAAQVGNRLWLGAIRGTIGTAALSPESGGHDSAHPE